LSPGKTSASRERLIAAVLALAGVVIALALGEAALRAIGFSYPGFHFPDYVTGGRLRPGAAGWSRAEGEVYVKISSQGLRDREHAVAKPPGVYRIAVLGDSYAEAMQVAIEQAFWSLLPQHLERCGFAPGRRIEAINFGVSGYGTAQELLTLRERAWSYAPDLVLLAFFPGNDVRNNSKALEKDNLRPFFVLRDGRLELDDSFRESEEFRRHMRRMAQFTALRELRLYELTRKLRDADLGVRHNSPIAVALAERRQEVPSLTEPGLDENVLRAPADAAWRDAWTVTEKLIVAMDEEVRSRGARFLLAVLSTPGAVYPDPALRKRYADYLGIDDLFYPEARLQQLAQRHAFQAVGLGREMQRHADASGEYLHGLPNGKPGFGHWNERGHALAASLIAAGLCSGQRSR
jgi:lysophospholipase L1-like esterase